MTEPICCITGQIAGHPDSCHDCDPCLSSWSVSAPVKKLISEVAQWRDKYADAATQLDALRLAGQTALDEMCRTVAPRDSFTDAVDALDAALHPKSS